MPPHTTIVFVHGDGGPGTTAWRAVLDRELAHLGFDTVEGQSDVSVVAPRYDDVLRDPAPSESVVRTPKRDTHEAARYHYELNKDATYRRLADLLWSGGSNSLPNWQWPQEVAEEFFEHVKPFRHSRDARRRAIRRVLAAVPTHGRVILIGHSLGSVVALAALTRLPERVDVPLFLTIGSPLGMDLFSDDVREESQKYFPYGQVQLWANAYGAHDPITLGRGIAAVYEPALDLRLPPSVRHGADEYLGQPAVATLIGQTIFGERPPSKDLARTASTDVVRGIHPGVVPILVRFQWLHAWERWAADNERPELRGRIARVIDLLAREVEQSYAALASAVDAPLPELPNLRRESALNLSTLGLEKRDLLAQLVYLSLQMVEAPFRAGEHSKSSYTVCRTRTWVAAFPPKAGESEAEVVSDQVRQARDEAESCFKSSNSLVPWLAGAGLALLAATGVGLAIAVPAGLAGGAAIVATLAAFGPGGIVGGVATLAALTGAGPALMASAAALGSTSREIRDAEDAERRAALDQVLALPPTQFRPVLVCLIATARATQLHGFDNPGDATWESLSVLEEQCARTLSIHKLTDDDDKGSPKHAWREKLDDVRRALRWMDGKGLSPRGDSQRMIEGRH